MQNKEAKLRKLSLKEAIRFHGHLGPYLVLGLKAGEMALNKLKCKKYFGLGLRVRGANQRPKSCLVDGLQLSTGATYGKGNILKEGGREIEVIFTEKKLGRQLKLSLNKELAQDLDNLNGHKDSEVFARKIFKIRPSRLFCIKT